eukprot:351066_1
MSKAVLTQHYNKLLKEGYKGSIIINIQSDLVKQSGKYHLNRLRGAVKGYQTSKNIYAALEKQMAQENIKLALKHVKAYEHNIKGVKNWINNKQKADEEKLNDELIAQTNRLEINPINNSTDIETTNMNDESEVTHDVSNAPEQPQHKQKEQKQNDNEKLHMEQLVNKLVENGFTEDEINYALQNINKNDQTAHYMAKWINENPIQINDNVDNNMHGIQSGIQADKQSSVAAPKTPQSNDNSIVFDDNEHNKNHKNVNNKAAPLITTFTDINISKTYPSLNYDTFTNRMKNYYGQYTYHQVIIIEKH